MLAITVNTMLPSFIESAIYCV